MGVGQICQGSAMACKEVPCRFQGRGYSSPRLTLPKVFPQAQLLPGPPPPPTPLEDFNLARPQNPRSRRPTPWASSPRSTQSSLPSLFRVTSPKVSPRQTGEPASSFLSSHVLGPPSSHPPLRPTPVGEQGRPMQVPGSGLLVSTAYTAQSLPPSQACLKQ